MNKQEIETFRNQREAYWYLKGYADAQEQINSLMNSRKQMYDLEYLDHLPED